MEKAKRVDTIDNLPRQRVRQVGAWTEQFSSNGRRYFYNRETEVSQWDKPTAWVKAEEIIDPDLENCDRLSYSSDRCGSSPEKIDVSDDENSPMEEEVDEEEQRRRAAEAEKAAKEEKEKKERDREYNKYYGYRRFLNEEVMDAKYRAMFGSERIVRPYTKENYPVHLSRRVEELNFQIDFDEKLYAASKARRMAETSLYNADFYQRKTEGLRELSKELEERHQNFQNNFETTMGTLVAQAKNESSFGSEFSAWIEWPDEKIVEHHEAMLARRSEEFQEKRARFMEAYKPKPPTPSPSPEPADAPTAAVILDERKLRELEDRSPSPSYEEPMEMVVSPVYEDEYDPTARAVPSHHDYSSHGSPSSSPDDGRSSANADSLRTQEYTRSISERPLPVEYILEPPPAFPILAPISPSPVISPVTSPVLSPTSPIGTPRSPVRSPLISPVRSPFLHHHHHLRSPTEASTVRSPIVVAADHPAFPHPFHPANPPVMMNPAMVIFDPTVPPPNLPPFLPPPPPAPILDKLFDECEFKKDDPFYRSVK